MVEEKKQLTYENTGDHHYGKVAYDADNGQISAGFIQNFSDHAAAALQFTNGVLSGTVVHSGDTHALQLDIASDGSYSGTYKDSKYNNLEISIKGGQANLVSGNFPETGISINGDHHRVSFKMGGDGKITGTIESQQTSIGTFKLSIDDGKVSGALVHSGDGHETSLAMSPDGTLKAAISIGKGNTKFSFTAEKGKIETKGFAGIGMKF